MTAFATAIPDTEVFTIADSWCVAITPRENSAHAAIAQPMLGLNCDRPNHSKQLSQRMSPLEIDIPVQPKGKARHIAGDNALFTRRNLEKIRTKKTGMKAVILLSGGLDSSTVLYAAKAKGLDCYALSFDYFQRHRQELDAAVRLAQSAAVSAHQTLRFDLRSWGGSALTDLALELPTQRSVAEMGTEIPITYVPARNTIFLSFGLAYAEAIGAQQVHIGVNQLDYSGYPDCRPDFLAAMQMVFQLGTKQGREGTPIEIVAPLVNLHKTDIVRLGEKLGVPWHQTWSCYSDGGGEVPPAACGVCDSCQLRLAAFASLGLEDPLPYRAIA
ncbi:MAG: 7-cyano-7-deazaguanine synthase QueC [Thermosynechococcaceae cyanobacterium MS004]|nr:7-cyano-7-deazaguanine synthase QueC [Thermosynechococcaceae cyanobacterium MS004]